MGASSATTDESYCLKWNDFSTNVSAAFRSLRLHGEFFDVTLLTKDGALQAHKVILSACSDFFRTVLKRMQKNHHPVMSTIYLRGVSYQDLESILEFMYQGEVNVLQCNLDEFLAVAEELQVKGLTNKDESAASSSESKAKSESDKKPPAAQAPFPKAVNQSTLSSKRSASSKTIHPGNKRVKQEQNDDDDDDDDDEVAVIEEEDNFVDASHQMKLDPEAVMETEEDYDDYESYYDEGDDSQTADQGPSEGGQGPPTLADTADGRVRCLLCEKVFTLRHNARVHVRETHSTQKEVFWCHICHAKYHVKRYLDNHLRSKHNITQSMLKSAFT